MHKIEKCDSPGGQFEPFAPMFEPPWPALLSKKRITIRRMHRIRNTQSPGFESLSAFQHRIKSEFAEQLAKYCSAIRASKILPATIPRMAARDAWFAAHHQAGRSVREIQDRYFTKSRGILVSLPAIRKAIQRAGKVTPAPGWDKSDAS